MTGTNARELAMAAEVSRLPTQPHSVEAEQAVLGAMLIDGKT